MKLRLFKLIALLTIMALIIQTIPAINTPLYAYYDRLNAFSFCEKPIKYAIGTIDSQSELTTKELEDIAEKAAEIWNDTNKTLFKFDQKASLKINLKYDERQSILNEIDNVDTQIKTKETTLTAEIEKYKADYNEINRQVTELNKIIDYWNEKGGAPKKEYNEITKKQKELDAKINQIQVIANNLNQSTDQLNTKINQINSLSEKFNSIINTKPEQGIYIPTENKIDIFFYDNEDELVHTIAHELGHALGLGHVDEKDSIMYLQTSDTLELSEDDMTQLNDYCQKQSRIDLIKNDILYFVTNKLATFTL